MRMLTSPALALRLLFCIFAYIIGWDEAHLQVTWLFICVHLRPSMFNRLFPFLLSLFVFSQLAMLSVLSAHADDHILFSEKFDKPVGDNWQQLKFNDLTDYKVVRDKVDTNFVCLRAFAMGTCSAFVTKVQVPAATNLTCTWRWKIDKCPKGAGDDVIGTFDHAARILIAFDTFIGPPRTINYVWANRVPTNSVFEHPWSSRSKFIAIETGNTNAGRWLLESRNVQADWDRLYKCAMPKIVGIGVFTYSQTTHQPVTAWYSDLELQKK